MYNHQPNIDRLSESLQRGKEESFGFANVMSEELIAEIKDFEKGLKPNEEVGLYIASFSGGTSVHIESIRYRNPYYVILSGRTEQGDRVSLVKHVTQIDILLIPVKVDPEENRKPRRFGFEI